MKAPIIYQSGGPENFVLEDIRLPKPKDGWVLVKVKAFGLTRSELMTRKGYSPGVVFRRVLGIECVGEAADDPSGEFQPGKKVAAFTGGSPRGLVAIDPIRTMKPYLFHIALFDLAFLVVIIIGIKFSSLLCFSKRTNQAANMLLSPALNVSELWIARILGIDIGVVLGRVNPQLYV